MSLRVLPLLALVACAAVAAADLNQDLELSDVAKLHQERAADDFLQTLGRDYKNQSFTIGDPQPNDRVLVLGDVTIMAPRPWWHVDKRFYSASTDPYTIHRIEFSDYYLTGTNGRVRVLEGGVNHKNVTIEFTSQRGKRMCYTIYIWGQ